jgi:hypothetical protein
MPLQEVVSTQAPEGNSAEACSSAIKQRDDKEIVETEDDFSIRLGIFIQAIDKCVLQHRWACLFYLLWSIVFFVATVVLGYYTDHPVCRYLFPILAFLTQALNHWRRAWEHFTFQQLCTQYKDLCTFSSRYHQYTSPLRFPQYANRMMTNFDNARAALKDVPGENPCQWAFFLITSFFNLPGFTGSSSPYGALRGLK